MREILAGVFPTRLKGMVSNLRREAPLITAVHLFRLVIIVCLQTLRICFAADWTLIHSYALVGR